MPPCWQAMWRIIFKICVIFGVHFDRQKVDKKSKPARKLKHTNSILEYFEYLCQMSWKSILTILSYTVSKLVRFFWDTVYVCMHHACRVPQLTDLWKRYNLDAYFPTCLVSCLRHQWWQWNSRWIGLLWYQMAQSSVSTSELWWWQCVRLWFC